MRRHVRHYVDLTQPLQEMVGDNYKKSRAHDKLEWTPELTEIYTKAQQAIVECKNLDYIQPDGDIHVYTDASDYGIGAYLCQIVDGEELPIEFISKTLTKTEKNWSTIEKEAYAIFYALRKWEQHLRDTHFTLFTDHKNLTYMSKEPVSAKIMRWKLAVQDYNCDVVYIPGEENVMADCLSRLCERKTPGIDQRERVIKTSIHALSTAEELQEWIPTTPEGDNGMIRDTYWATNAEEVAMFHSLKMERRKSESTEKKREKATHIPPKQWKMIQKCHNVEIGH